MTIRLRRLMPCLHVALASAACVPAVAVADSRPNMIFVLMDDMGYGDLRSHGQRHIQMPNVDRMEREGLRFTNVYTGSVVCAPSRSALMTGQHTGHTTVRGNSGNLQHGGVPCTGGGSGARVPLRDEDVTVAEVLKSAGYATGLTGKWGLGEPGTSGVPNRQGFDEFLGFLNQRRAHSYYPTHIWRNDDKLSLEGNTGTREDFAKEGRFVHDLFTDFTLDFIRRHAGQDRPFFLYAAYTIPHARWQIPELEPYAAETDWTQEQKVYASMLTRVDREIGRMFDVLKETGIDRNTIVFFCSDNGAQNRYEGVFDSSGPLRGSKGTLYDGGLRTAMIVRWPGVIRAGAVSDAIWYFPDVLPTLAELAGIAPPEGIDGVSVVPSLLSKPQPELRDRSLYWESPEKGFRQAARIHDWKAVRNGHNRAIELYHLENDIGETTNLAADHPDRVAQFERLFREARTPSPNWPSPLDP